MSTNACNRSRNLSKHPNQRPVFRCLGNRGPARMIRIPPPPPLPRPMYACKYCSSTVAEIYLSPNELNSTNPSLPYFRLSDPSAPAQLRFLLLRQAPARPQHRGFKFKLGIQTRRRLTSRQPSNGEISGRENLCHPPPTHKPTPASVAEV